MDIHKQLLGFFRALGQKERLLIIGQLTARPQTVAELARATGLKEMALLRHLALLEESGLVAADESRYWTDVPYLETLNREIWSTMRVSDSKPQGDEAILARFVKDGRLIKFPTKESHRLIMLKWAVQIFDPENTYSENEASDMLMRLNDDYASLRRYLIDYGLMAREDGEYWRIDSRE